MSFQVMLARLFLEVILRQLAGEAGPVAGQAADSASVLDVFQGEERFLDDLVRRFAFTGGHPADTAGPRPTSSW